MFCWVPGNASYGFLPLCFFFFGGGVGGGNRYEDSTEKKYVVFKAGTLWRYKFWFYFTCFDPGPEVIKIFHAQLS